MDTPRRYRPLPARPPTRSESAGTSGHFHPEPVVFFRRTAHIYQAFAADDRVALVDEEPAGVEQAWVELATTATCSPKLWMDAYLAAFARSAGYTLVTTDTAFTQFPGLHLRLLTTATPPDQPPDEMPATSR